jgi:hypothetical protein
MLEIAITLIVGFAGAAQNGIPASDFPHRPMGALMRAREQKFSSISVPTRRLVRCPDKKAANPEGGNYG